MGKGLSTNEENGSVVARGVWPDSGLWAPVNGKEAELRVEIRDQEIGKNALGLISESTTGRYSGADVHVLWRSGEHGRAGKRTSR